jgi:hypothetical protein
VRDATKRFLSDPTVDIEIRPSKQGKKQNKAKQNKNSRPENSIFRFASQEDPSNENMKEIKYCKKNTRRL